MQRISPGPVFYNGSWVHASRSYNNQFRLKVGNGRCIGRNAQMLVPRRRSRISTQPAATHWHKDSTIFLAFIRFPNSACILTRWSKTRIRAVQSSDWTAPRFSPPASDCTYLVADCVGVGVIVGVMVWLAEGVMGGWRKNPKGKLLFAPEPTTNIPGTLP